MRELVATIDIEASPDEVWQVLTDFDRYPEWNPFITEIRGVPEEGARLQVRIEPPDGRSISFAPEVRRAAETVQLTWLGRVLVPGVFDGEHSFEIRPLEIADPRRVRFTQRERFRGLLVPLLWRSLDRDTRRGFEQMNEALKDRAEELAEARDTEDTEG